MIPINWKSPDSLITNTNTNTNNSNNTNNTNNTNTSSTSIFDITNSIDPNISYNNAITDTINVSNTNTTTTHSTLNTIDGRNTNDNNNTTNKKKRSRRSDMNDEPPTINNNNCQTALYDKDSIDAIFADPNTTIVFPRLFKMRMLQYKNGVDLTGLNSQKLGMVNVKSIHHISKVVETRGDYYRVRVCRTCSKYYSLIELGSYSDLESALLVNDMYEIQQQKYDNLCLLDKIDNIEYLEKMTAKRRGVTDEQPLFAILQQRMSKLQEKKDKLKTSPEEVFQTVHHPSESVFVRKITFKQILDMNHLDYYVPFLLWIGCDFVLPSIVASLPGYLMSITEKNNFDSRVLDNRTSEDNTGNFPKYFIFLLISSLLPGNSNDCKEVFDRLNHAYPTTYETSYEFMDATKHVLIELAAFDNAVFEQTDKLPETLCSEHFPRCLRLFKKNFEVCAYADYKLRLLCWDNAELTDNEVFIQGIQNQIEIRVTVLLGILNKVDALKVNQTGLKLHVLNTLLSKAVCAMLYACLINSTVALVASKLTINFYKLKFALQLCNKFLPYLLPNVHNAVLLQDFFQRQSDLLAFVLIDSATRGHTSILVHLGLEGSYNAGNDAGNDDEEKMKLSSSLACEMLKLSVKCLNDLQAHGAVDTVNYLELSVRTFSSLFGTFVAFSLRNNNNFPNQLGLTFAKVTNSLSDSLIKFEKCIKSCDCCVFSTHTLISLNNLIENCYLYSQKHLETSRVIAAIAKKILLKSGSRFIVGKLLVQNIDSRTAEKAVTT